MERGTKAIEMSKLWKSAQQNNNNNKYKGAKQIEQIAKPLEATFCAEICASHSIA